MQKRVRFTEHSGQSRKQEYREERRKQDTSNDDCRCAALFSSSASGSGRTRPAAIPSSPAETFILTLTVTHSVSGTSSQQRRSFHAP